MSYWNSGGIVFSELLNDTEIEMHKRQEGGVCSVDFECDEKDFNSCVKNDNINSSVMIATNHHMELFRPYSVCTNTRKQVIEVPLKNPPPDCLLHRR